MTFPTKFSTTFKSPFYADLSRYPGPRRAAQTSVRAVYCKVMLAASSRGCCKGSGGRRSKTWIVACLHFKSAGGHATISLEAEAWRITAQKLREPQFLQFER